MSEKYAPYSALAIANYFIHNVNISPLKLQKMVYYAHGWFLGFMDEPLIIEPVECWKFGPVIKIIYDNFKIYGNQIIDRKAEGWDFEKQKLIILHIHKNDDFTKELLDAIIEGYGKYTAIQLSNLTHEKGTPWYIANRKHKSIIENELIHSYFKEKLESANV